MVRVSMYSNHWPCLFPQRGPGRKHDRPIYLADWRSTATVAGTSTACGANGKVYDYSRYNFTNASSDIRALFCASCDALGIAWRRMNARNISVARREAVAPLDEFVGPKR